MSPKVSVIIPIYNSSLYIARCCRSLFDQTLDSLQYIFVDDGSDDGSLDIINAILIEYPHRLDQVICISQPEHLGVGYARQIGLERAKGDYIIHCDSDDWVEPKAYESLYQRAYDSNADIVTCGYSIDWEGKDQSVMVPALCSDHKPLSFDIGPQTGSLALKLIRRKLIDKYNLQVTERIIWGEDFCLSLEALLLSDNTKNVDEPLYHYVQHDHSLTHSLTLEKCLSLIKCGEVIESFLKEHALYRQYAFQLNWLKFQLKQYLLIFPQTRNISLWRTIYPECHHDLLQYHCSRYLKLSAWLIVHNFGRVAVCVLKMKDIVSSLKYR